MEPVTQKFNDNGHEFELTIMESNAIHPLRKTPPVEKGFWGYWTVRKDGKPISGLPVQDGHGKIMIFKTVDEAITEGKKIMGFSND